MPPFPPLLLVDIGNTSVKLRRATPDALLGKTKRVPTASLRDRDAGRAALGPWNYERVVLCSVVPDATRQLMAAIPEGVPATVLTPDLRGLPVDLSRYPRRRTLGTDRLANMIGALALYGKEGCPLIVVDFGTAATFNVLDENARFLGGVIAPGLAGMSGYLSARGSQLPPLGRPRVPSSAVGRSTRAAMMAGTVLGYRGLAREVLVSLLEEAPGSQVIATGGDAPFMARLLPGLIHHVEPALTLHGLRIIAAMAG